MERVITVEQEKSEDKEEKVGVKHKLNYREHHRQMMGMYISNRRRQYLKDWNKRLWDCKKVI